MEFFDSQQYIRYMAQNTQPTAVVPPMSSSHNSMNIAFLMWVSLIILYIICIKYTCVRESVCLLYSTMQTSLRSTSLLQ